MRETGQADQQLAASGDTAHLCPVELSHPRGVPRVPRAPRHRPGGAPSRYRDLDLDDERFTRETADIRDYLIRYAARLTHQRADAEDLVQETLLKAYLSFNSYREGTHLKSWLGRIMSNTWIDKHRSTQRRPAEQLSADVNDSWLAIGGSTVTNGSTESAEAVVLRLSPSDAERALHDLPEDLREIVYYACIAGYRNTEIADLLKMPVGTVGSRLHRGKALLRLSLTNPAAS